MNLARMQTRGERGPNPENFVDVIEVWPLICRIPFGPFVFVPTRRLSNFSPSDFLLSSERELLMPKRSLSLERQSRCHGELAISIILFAAVQK